MRLFLSLRAAAFLAAASIVYFGSMPAAVCARELLTFDSATGDEQVTAFAGGQLEFWRPDAAILGQGSAPAGQALRLWGAAGSSFELTSTALNVVDWRKSATLAFWVHRSAEEAQKHPTASLDVHLVEEDRKAYFWRKLELHHSGWLKVELPLVWFRWSHSRIPRWDKVRSLAFLLRGPAALTIDTVWTVPTETTRGDFPSAELIASIAFPKDDLTTKVRSLETRDVQLLTNAPSLDLESLAGHLASVAKEMRREMPFLPEPDRGPVLVIFYSHNEYREFVPRYAQHLNAVASHPESAGFTIEGASTSSWSDHYGTRRPVYTHEFVHGYLSSTMRLASRGDWVHQGLACRYQLKFHPQANVNQIIQEGLRTPQAHDPLKDLCDGRLVASNRYWQAATICQMLMTDQRYQAGFPVLLERLRDSKSNDLGPHLESVWQTDFDKLTADWRAFCEREYPKP